MVTSKYWTSLINCHSYWQVRFGPCNMWPDKSTARGDVTSVILFYVHLSISFWFTHFHLSLLHNALCKIKIHDPLIFFTVTTFVLYRKRFILFLDHEQNSFDLSLMWMISIMKNWHDFKIQILIDFIFSVQSLKPILIKILIHLNLLSTKCLHISQVN